MLDVKPIIAWKDTGKWIRAYLLGGMCLACLVSGLVLLKLWLIFLAPIFGIVGMYVMSTSVEYERNMLNKPFARQEKIKHLLK